MQTLQALEVYDDFTPAQELDAKTACDLVDANRWYHMSNHAGLDKLRRLQAREKAQILLDSVLSRLPESSDAINLKGRIALDEGNLTLARDLIEQAIRLNPEKAGFWCNRGFVSLLQEQYDQAESYFNQALVCDTGSVQAFSSIALCYYLKGDYLGAFLRYRSLLRKGALNQAALSTLAECCTYLSADRFDESLEDDLLTLFDIDDFQHHKLSQLACSILKTKYDLTNENSPLDIDELASDQLLISVLATGSVRDIYVEDLAGLLRQHILIEVSQTGELRDGLQNLAMAIGILGAQSDYLLHASEDESVFIGDLEQCVRETLSANWQPADVIGALIIISMYKQLYSTNYSYKLLALELSDWPTGMHALLEQNLYLKSDLHAIRFSLPQNETALSRGFDSPYAFSAYPMWHQIPYNAPSSYARALCAEVGKENVPPTIWHQATCMLIIGCESGERAIRLARSFDNVHIIALDQSEENIAYARYQAKAYGLSNVEFNLFKAAEEIPELGCYFDVIEVHDAHCDDISIILAAKSLLDSDGLIRLGFKEFAEEVTDVIAQLQTIDRLPTAEVVRQMRAQAYELVKHDANHPLLRQDWFYSLSGCRQIMFRKNLNHRASLGTVLGKTGLSPVSLLDQVERGYEQRVYSKKAR